MVFSSLESESCPYSSPGSSPAEKGEPVVNIKEDVVSLVLRSTASLFLAKNTLNVPRTSSSQGRSGWGFSTCAFNGLEGSPLGQQEPGSGKHRAHRHSRGRTTLPWPSANS